MVCFAFDDGNKKSSSAMGQRGLRCPARIKAGTRRFKLRAKGQELRASLLWPKVVFAGDPQALHFRLQRSSLQTKPVSCAGGAGEQPASFPQHSENMLTLCGVESVIGGTTFQHLDFKF